MASVRQPRHGAGGEALSFNSAAFFLFFAIVYSLYLLLQRRLRLQNWLLLAAGYVFYGCWSVKFLSLLVWTTLFDFYIAKAIGRTGDPRRRKLLLCLSLTSSLVILGFFKYFNFFAGNVEAGLRAVGLHPGSAVIRVVLPMGISFYTFQTMAYVIEVYRRRVEPARDLLEFAVFSAFFPQLVAGPIERAWTLLPQVQRPRGLGVSQINAGLWLVLWGYFKKLVVADNLAPLADVAFGPGLTAHGLDLVVGVLAFTFQIYADFSGYTDIARGLARLMGFELMVNFRLPYFATDPSDFWARWHITLSQWFRDYVYIPLGGSRHGRARTYANLMVTMLLCGLWHGAAWHFVAWGGYHGLLAVAYHALGLRTRDRPGPGSALGIALRTALMFGFTLLGWIIFRVDHLGDVVVMLRQLSLQTSVSTSGNLSALTVYVAPLLAIQAWQCHRRELLVVPNSPVATRAVIYALLLAGIIVLSAATSVDFIYFRF